MSLLVSNTGPLIALTAIDALELLPQLYGRVVIPEEVRKELHAAPHGVMRFPFAETMSWLEVQQSSIPIDPLLTTILDVNGNVKVYQLRELKSVPIPGRECFNPGKQRLWSYLLSG